MIMNNQLRINRDDTIALIIDIQERLYPFIHDNEKLTSNIVRLVKGLKILNIPMIVTQQYTKGLGDTISPVREALGDYTHLEKMSFSCCGDDTVMNAIRSSGKKNVIICGIESHVCVLQTCLDLIENGFNPVLIEDCVGSREPNNKKYAVKRMHSAGAVVSTYESILFELTVVSGTPEFKEISKLVK
jgi:nicotinamidase-related amidase